ncbi:MAG TPA: transglutaminase domain-containing protein, partial [Thermoplasmata archaeon]|nr:transglutaminase domain-containing protein [Thermoplasmata archaeon]
MSGNNQRGSREMWASMALVLLLVSSTLAAAYLQAYGDDQGPRPSLPAAEDARPPLTQEQNESGENGFLNETVALFRSLAVLEGALSNLSARLQAVYREFLEPGWAEAPEEECSACGGEPTVDVNDVDIDELLGQGILSEEGTSTLASIKAYALEALVALAALRDVADAFTGTAGDYADLLSGYASRTNDSRVGTAVARYNAALTSLSAELTDLVTKGDRMEELLVPLLSRPDAVMAAPFIRGIRSFKTEIVDVLDEIHAATADDPDAGIGLEPLSHFSVLHDAGDLPAMSPDRPLSGNHTPADLNSTMDAWVSTSVYQKAHSMDVVKLYWWVREAVEYEPYIGSLKGSDQTLMQRAGNDVDQASLLIAMLRERGIPARYVYGTIQAPWEEVANWLVVDTQDNATAALRRFGIPADNLGDDILLEHCWVAAYVDSQWIEMDPSWYAPPPGEGGNLTVINGITYYNGTQVREEETEPDLSNRTAFPAGVDYDVVSRTGIYAELPEDMRHTVTISLSDGNGELLSYTDFAGHLAAKNANLHFSLTPEALEIYREEG